MWKQVLKQILMRRYKNLPYYLASSVNRQDWIESCTVIGYPSAWARWSYLACSRLPAVYCKENFSANHIINPLLTKLVRSRWLDIGVVLFFGEFMVLDSVSVHKHAKKKERRQYPAVLTSHLTYNPYILHKGCNVRCKLCGCGACPKEMFETVLILAIFIVLVLYKGKLTWMKEGHSQSCKGFACDL